MYAQINANAATLVRERRLPDAVRAYAHLRARFGETDVQKDGDFRRRYRIFWALNVARLGESWLNRYFGLLEDLKGQRDVSLEAIVRELSSGAESGHGGGSLQFSFASKLLHMLDPAQPIYDRLIANFYFFDPPIAQRAFDERLRVLLHFYEFVRTDYRRVLAEGKLADAIRSFRSVHADARTFTDEKVIDFLVWTYVRDLRGGAQREGRLLYE